MRISKPGLRNRASDVLIVVYHFFVGGGQAKRTINTINTNKKNQ